MSTVFIEEVVKRMEGLPEEAQRRVLDFTRALQDQPTSSPRDIIARCAGILPHEDAEAMRQAIEEDCERIDADGW